MDHRGPVSYQFLIPDGTPITVQPQTGTLLPGEKQRLSVQFRPVLPDEEIRACALDLIEKRQAEEAILR